LPSIYSAKLIRMPLLDGMRISINGKIGS